MRFLSRFRTLPALERYCLGLLAASTLFMVLVGCWELAAPFGAGHVAVLPARAMMADNMVRFGILYPVRSYAVTRPDISLAYAHHPWGTYYLFTLARLIFGSHPWAIRLVPVCFSVAMPSLLYFVARRLWGSVAGALSAFGWVVLPITLAFAQFPSFEMFSIAGILGVTLAGLRYSEHPTRGRLWALLGTAFLCSNTDWIGSLYACMAAVTALFVLAFAPRKDPVASDLRPPLQGIIGVLSVTLLTVMLYAVLFHRIGHFEDFTTSATHRALGNESPFTEVLARRRYWIEVMFTKPGIALGVLGAWVMLVRVLVYRRFTELLPLLLLSVSTFHYVYFKNGADVHIYWPLPFAAQFALSLGVLAASATEVHRYLARRSSRGTSPQSNASSRSAWVSASVVTSLGLLALPDGLRALDYARDSGCRLNDDGQLNLQDHDKNFAIAAFKQDIPQNKRVLLDASLFPNWSAEYALERESIGGGPQVGLTIYGVHYGMYDLRFASASALTFLRNARHRQIGPFLLVNAQGEGRPTAVESLTYEPRGLFSRYWVSSHDPSYRLTRDPYRTWELFAHLGVEPNPVPKGLEDPARWTVAHNVAVSEQQMTRARELLSAGEALLDRHSAHKFADGTRVLGHRLVEGRPPRLEVYFLANAGYGNGAAFDVYGRVSRAPSFSFVVADDKEKKYGSGFELMPTLWKPGYVYVSRVEVRERPGSERFYGIWRTRRGARTNGTEITLPLFERP